LDFLYNVRDTRTLFDIAGVSLKDGNHVTTHKAVEDAERQAIVVQSAYMKLMKAGLLLNDIDFAYRDKYNRRILHEPYLTTNILNTIGNLLILEKIELLIVIQKNII
jgi:hypothetical protein